MLKEVERDFRVILNSCPSWHAQISHQLIHSVEDVRYEEACLPMQVDKAVNDSACDCVYYYLNITHIVYSEAMLFTLIHCSWPGDSTSGGQSALLELDHRC